jgi:sugar phosphate isomerase/epimerase
MDRRRFLDVTIKSLVGGALVPGSLAGTALAGDAADGKMPSLHLFSKVLQFLDYAEMADAAVELGLDGLDLTVRPGGNVDPENFERDLPAVINAMNAAGLSCEMMVTNIVSTENRRDFDLLAMARSLGIKSYRTGALRYDENTHPMESVEQFKHQLSALAEWNEEIGITGMYQNHSGAGRLGAAIWDLYLVLRELNPDHIACQFDIRHAVTEGGLMWPDSFRMMKPHIRSLAVKDFIWADVDGKWRVFSTPIGEGMIDFSRYLRMLKDAELNVPVSLHCEYDLGGAEKGRREPTTPESEIRAAIGKDIATINKLWKEA